MKVECFAPAQLALASVFDYRVASQVASHMVLGASHVAAHVATYVAAYVATHVAAHVATHVAAHVAL